MSQKAKRIAVSVINAPSGHRDVTSLAHARRYVKSGIARFVPGQNAIEFIPVAVMALEARLTAHSGPPINACRPKPATVTWPAQFTELIGQYRPDLPTDPSFYLTFLPQGGIGLDQRTGKGKAA